VIAWFRLALCGGLREQGADWSVISELTYASPLAQASPPSDAKLTPAGFGVGWIVQRVPFQRSAIVVMEPSEKCCSPVAVQAVGDVPEVDPRHVCTAQGDCGTGVTRQR